MGKKARRAALMGFVGGVLSDVQRRWQTKRAEEAEARKEARLAEIRAVERGEDRAASREMFDAQQASLDKRDERNFEQQKEILGETQTFAREQSQAEMAARAADRAAARGDAAAARAESRADRQAARGEAAAERAAARDDKSDTNKETIFYNPKTGATVVKPAGMNVSTFVAGHAQKGRSLVPYSPGLMNNYGEDQFGAGSSGSTAPTPSYQLDFMKYPVTGRPPK